MFLLQEIKLQRFIRTTKSVCLWKQSQVLLWFCYSLWFNLVRIQSQKQSMKSTTCKISYTVPICRNNDKSIRSLTLDKLATPWLSYLRKVQEISGSICFTKNNSEHSSTYLFAQKLSYLSDVNECCRCHAKHIRYAEKQYSNL